MTNMFFEPCHSITTNLARHELFIRPPISRHFPAQICKCVQGYLVPLVHEQSGSVLQKLQNELEEVECARLALELKEAKAHLAEKTVEAE